ncbi:MAG TPA: sugar transferase [Pyrinomonadaceae bacterium]|nr:sugar transferase [Pyrinomonadaceae bacterium]
MTDRHGTISNAFLKLSDLALTLAALGLVIVHRYSPTENVGFLVSYLSERVKVGNAILGFLLVLFWHAAFAAQGLYVSHRLSPIAEEIKEVARAVSLTALMLLVAAQFGRWPTINLVTVASFGALSFILISFMRLALRSNLRRLRERGHNVKSLLIVGGGARARRIAGLISNRPELGYVLLGFVENDPVFANAELAGASWLGGMDDLPRIVAGAVIDEVAIALPIKSHYSHIESAVALLEEQGITTHVLSDLFPQKLARSQPIDLGGMPFVSLHSAPRFSWRTEAKRIMDLVAASILLVLTSPLFLFAAIAIKLESAGPIFFVQERVGLSKRRFRMIKFRTMSVDAEARMKDIEHLNEKTGPIFKIKNDPRITRVGKWLRRTSIDELPQLVNVLLGDMSIVGPRPLSVRDAVGMEEAWQKRRFSVKPGLTCLWQVSGRSNLSFEQWMQLDLEYIDRWSLKLDATILLRTIPAIVLARGAS